MRGLTDILLNANSRNSNGWIYTADQLNKSLTICINEIKREERIKKLKRVCKK